MNLIIIARPEKAPEQICYYSSVIWPCDTVKKGLDIVVSIAVTEMVMIMNTDVERP